MADPRTDQRWKPQWAKDDSKAGKNPKLKPGGVFTIKSLRLDLEAAQRGETWLLLPKGFREREAGSTYPLPSRTHELQKLAGINIPLYKDKQDCGCYYLRRALKEWKSRQQKRSSAIEDSGRKTASLNKAFEKARESMKKMKQQAKDEVDRVRIEVDEAIASLTDLFALGRRGIDGQMKAYLDGDKFPHHDGCKDGVCHEDCQAEYINAKAFRECFRMVTQAVKGLGLPSDQRKAASEAVLEEAAAALKATQEVVAMAPGSDLEN